MPDRKKDRIEQISLGEHSVGDIFDVSEDGIGYHCDCVYSEGDLLEVELNGLDLKARVAYCKGMGAGSHVGLKYVDILSSQAEALYEIVTAISTGSPAKFAIIKKIS